MFNAQQISKEFPKTVIFAEKLAFSDPVENRLRYCQENAIAAFYDGDGFYEFNFVTRIGEKFGVNNGRFERMYYETAANIVDKFSKMRSGYVAYNLVMQSWAEDQENRQDSDFNRQQQAKQAKIDKAIKHSEDAKNLLEFCKMHKSKGKKGKIDLASNKGGTLETVSATIHGPLAVHKKYQWSITHIESGALILDDFDRKMDAEFYLPILLLLDWNIADGIPEQTNNVMKLMRTARKDCEDSMVEIQEILGIL